MFNTALLMGVLFAIFLVVGFALGGAAAVGTAVLYWLSRPSEGAESRPTTRPSVALPSVGAAPLAGGALVVWRGSY